MNTLPRDKKILILKCLTEGNSLRATARLAGVSRNTVDKLLIATGKVCAAYQDAALQDLPCQRIQVDEVWSFVYAKAKNAPRAVNPPRSAGDVWTWTAICADTKLIPSWRVGDRSGATAIEFMDDLRYRLANRMQLTSDGHKAYLEAVEGAFGANVDYAMLVKMYGHVGDERRQETRYSPSECIGARKEVVMGNPNPDDINTSYVERQNLTMRMSIRRFTRLTNAFSKKLENHVHAIALHFMHYNFCRVHGTIRTTPAIAARVTDRVWDVADIVDMVDAAAPKPNRPNTYRKREISN